MKPEYPIIRLGNRDACVYRRNPAAPDGVPMDKLEIWAEIVCDLDISSVPKVGEMIKNTKGEDDYQVSASHREAMLRSLIDRPVLQTVLTGQKLCTHIGVSPQSTLREAVAECMHVWNGDGKMGLPHSQGKPAWIAGNWPALVEILKDELGVPEVRALEIES